MLPIQQMFVKYNYTTNANVPLYIVVHDTGNPGKGANALSHYKYFSGGNRNASAHYFVDDSNIIQIIRDKDQSWHCGDGHGKYGIRNNNSIGVEICINQDGNYEKAKSNAIDLIRYLMEKYNIPLDRVVRHYDASRKNCPASMSANGWAAWYEFKDRLINKEELTMTQYEELQGKLDQVTEIINTMGGEIQALKNPVIYNYIDDNLPAWARPTVQKLADKGLLQGDENGLGLTEDLLRILVVNDRAGLYGE